MLSQFLNYILVGMAAGFTVFYVVYSTINKIKEQLISSAIGVPVIVVSIVLFVISIIRFLLKKLK